MKKIKKKIDTYFQLVELQSQSKGTENNESEHTDRYSKVTESSKQAWKLSKSRQKP